MFPLRDNIPSRTVPYVNLLLIAANAAIFLYEVSLGAAVEDFLLRFGLVPARFFRVLHADPWAVESYLRPLFSSMFLHGGWMHVIGNMWSLYIFGDNVEDALGHGRYLFFYLAAGLAAAATQLWMSSGSGLPMIGASGAIAGIMGAYFVLYPGARVVTLIPFFGTAELPAFLFLGVWLWTQFYSGASAALAGTSHAGGVAWWAHVGGFIGGILLLGSFLAKRPSRRRK